MKKYKKLFVGLLLGFDLVVLLTGVLSLNPGFGVPAYLAIPSLVSGLGIFSVLTMISADAAEDEDY